MKRILSSVLLVAVFTAVQARAQNYYNPNFQPGCVSGAPVACQTPVVYYQAPVCATPPVIYDYDRYPRRNPSVIYIGGGRNYNYNSQWDRSCGSGTQVIRFGHVQAYRQGYQFRARR